MTRGPLGAFALAAFLISVCPARAGEPASYIENDTRSGLVMKAVEPHLPRHVRYMTGHVDVEGTVTPAGSIAEPTLVPDREESADFVEPLRRVLPGWRFNSLQGPDCGPLKQPIRLRVRFEDGDMHVLHLPVEQPISRQDPGMRALHTEPPQYPRDFLRKGIGANVYARAEVAVDGSVTSVRVRAFSRGAEGDALLPFEVAATRAARKWLFTPAPEGLDRPRAACLTFQFNFWD